MIKFITTSLIIFFSQFLNAQLNLIKNNSFELLNTPLSPNSFPLCGFTTRSGFGEYSKLINWSSRTKKWEFNYTYSGVTGTYCGFIHSPDIYNEPFDSYLGNYYTSMGEYELIYQKMLKNSSMGGYIISGFLRNNPYDLTNSIGNLNIYLSSTEFTYSNESNITEFIDCNSNYADLNNNIFYTKTIDLNNNLQSTIGKNGYVNFEVEVPYDCDNQDENIWFGMETRDKFTRNGSFCYSGSSSFLDVDNINIFKNNCYCPPEIFKENTIHRNNTILKAS